MSNMVVNTNVQALNSHRAMKGVGTAQSKASARLSSGLKINSAADDAAGLAISEKMRAQIRGLDMASKNSQDAISLIQTAEGGMQEIDNMLQRIRELTVQASNDTNENNDIGTGDRQKMQDEVDQLIEEIDSMAERVEFNKKKVINGSFADTGKQFAIAKTELDRTALDKAKANATVSAYKSALGVSDDPTTSTSAYGQLNAAQDAMDTNLPVYSAALKVFGEAEVGFKQAKEAYRTTYTAMSDQLDLFNISASDVTDNMLDKTHADYKGADFVSAFKNYQKASNAWGLEELGFDKTNVTAANVATTTAFTGVADESLINTSAYQTALGNYNTALDAAKADTVANAYLQHVATKMAYETAESNLTDALATANKTVGAGGTLIASDIAGALETAMKAYAKAANAYGIDGMDVRSTPGLVALNSAITALPAVGTTAASGTTAAAFAALTGTTDTDRATTLGLVEAYVAADAGGTLKSNYDNAVTALNTAITNAATTDFSAAATGSVTNLALFDAITAYNTAANAWGVDGETITAEMFGNATAGAGSNFATTIAYLNGLYGTAGTVSTGTSIVAPTATGTAGTGTAAEAYGNLVTNSVTANAADADISTVTGNSNLTTANYTLYANALTTTGLTPGTVTATGQPLPILTLMSLRQTLGALMHLVLAICFQRFRQESNRP